MSLNDSSEFEEPNAHERRWGGSAEWKPRGKRDRVDAYNPRLTVLDQCLAMIRYGTKSGLSLPADAVDIVDVARREADPQFDDTLYTPLPLSKLTEAHKQLVAAVAPANPNTIELLADEEAHGVRRYFGATRYARSLAFLAMALFTTFVVLQIWRTSSGAPLWLDILVTALASVIGGIFYVMFALSRQLSRGSFERGLEGRYTNLIILGGLAGTALAFLIVEPVATTANAPASTSVSVLLTRPLLALLGGFSARAVYRILERLVSTVEALIKGSGDELVAAQELAAKARATAEIFDHKTETVTDLLRVTRGIAAGSTTDQIRSELEVLVAKIIKGLPPSAQPPQSE
ncbi:hypothetical protein [Amycolatopsis sp. BJA-103]|uniref:hypothetical protein n=1 Tax=unclassified Amycolatopsis TaxID=2618356 RepID=UPI000C770190|nr:hypothetical protein [Amycolatopsis sp. BJA-103]AUI60070.1 hypothetical protein BKN51_18920 [Amycolatopsis sp. BJA-103]PNE14431.1 hypothetical protein B1H26_35365 [Amycolatopsis sp. BJA-103]